MNTTSRSLIASLLGMAAIAPHVRGEIEGEIRIGQGDGYIFRGTDGRASTNCHFDPGPSLPILVEVRDEKGALIEGAKVSMWSNAAVPLAEAEGYAASPGGANVTDARGLVVVDCRGVDDVTSAKGVKLKKISGFVTAVVDGYPMVSVDLAKKFPKPFADDSLWTPKVTIRLMKLGVAEQASAFLSSLPPDQLKQASLPFEMDDGESVHGVVVGDLHNIQRKSALDLLRSGLGERGITKLEAIMKQEAALTEAEPFSGFDEVRAYRIAILGKPGDAKGWAWQFKGPDLSMKMVFKEGKPASTQPLMFSNPTGVREDPPQDRRALTIEEDKARILAQSLIDFGKPVLFSEETPEKILAAADRSKKCLEAVGVSVSELSEAQNLMLKNLMAEYIDRHCKEVAAVEWDKIRMVGMDHIRFGWSGSLKAGEAFYYRIQGPTFLIEAANGEANETALKTIWRSLDAGFGRDFLAEHYKDHKE